MFNQGNNFLQSRNLLAFTRIERAQVFEAAGGDATSAIGGARQIFVMNDYDVFIGEIDIKFNPVTAELDGPFKRAQRIFWFVATGTAMSEADQVVSFQPRIWNGILPEKERPLTSTSI